MTNTVIVTKVVTQVISLFAEQDSELCIKQGRVWATVGTGGEDVDDNYGDHFLEAGQKLSVLKGQNLVFESMHADIPVFFDFMAAKVMT
jgi:Protein of unknown function (DUF2917)